MSPRSADPAARTALLAAAARLLAADGPRALTTRRLAAEAGVTTMALYTHFGSLDEVRRAVRREGFDRLTANLSALTLTDDPVADLAMAALTYFAAGLSHPELYRAMFVDQPPEDDHLAGESVFERVRAAVARCVDAGRFHREGPADPVDSLGLAVWAAEVWSAQHGMVTLALTGLLPADQIRFVLVDMIYRLCVGFGDDHAAARHSVDMAAHAAHAE